jgi:DNA-binding response OmpR family regulator
MPAPELKRVLMVDDEVDLAELVAHSLKSKGVVVDSVCNANQVLVMSVPKSYGLFLLDVMLPGIKGLELCRMLREDWRTQGTPILVISALGGQLDRQEVLEAGADDYMPKPFLMQELVRRVLTLLERGCAQRPMLSFPRFGLDLAGNQLYIENRQVPLDKNEAILLKTLALLSEGETVSPDRLVSLLWNLNLHLGLPEIEKVARGLSMKTALAGRKEPLVSWDRARGLCWNPAEAPPVGA